MPDSAALDQLLDDLISVIEKRRSEGEGGKAYIQRGIQKLEKEKPYEAIRMFGRAEVRLMKEEYRDELIVALIGASFAYERTGLLWAARSKVLAATDLCLLEFVEEGVVNSKALKALQRLVWLELQLGRLPQLLTTLELSAMVEAHLNLSVNEKGQLSDERETQEGVIGILLLNASLNQLRDLERLPDTLVRLGLLGACMALLWALGHEDRLREEGYISKETLQSELLEFFSQWDDQPAKADLPPAPNLMAGERVSMRTVILGCELVVSARNNLTSVCIAEAVLSALESFLSTSLDQRVFPYRHEFRIDVRPAVDTHAKLDLGWVEDARHGSVATITHPMPFQFDSKEDLVAYNEWLHDLLIEVISRIAIIDDLETWLETVAGDEIGFSRAISLGNVPAMTENIFGDSPNFSLESWIEADATRYPLLRSEVWQGESEAERPDTTRPLQWGSGEPPGELLDTERMKHSDRRVSSVINVTLWDKARWCGTGFATFGPQHPPCIAPVFQNFEPGKLIFQEWLTRFGKVDSQDAIRIAIITRIERKSPANYAVVISENPDMQAHKPGTQFVSVARCHRMDTVDPLNLERFLEAYKRTHAFFLAPMESSASGSPKIDTSLCITKNELVVRDAWQIGENDPDMVVLQPGDDPIIPENVSDVPVLRAMKRLRTRSH